MLETERLILRALSADEVNSLRRISNEPNVRLYLWDNELVSEATIKSLIVQSDRMFSKEKIYSASADSSVWKAWRNPSSGTS